MTIYIKSFDWHLDIILFVLFFLFGLPYVAAQLAGYHPVEQTYYVTGLKSEPIIVKAHSRLEVLGHVGLTVWTQDEWNHYIEMRKK